MKFGLLMLAEYAGILAFSGIATVLFLGGYQPLLGLSFIPGPFWMIGKLGLLAFLIIWLRVTYPRLREDQLQRFSWVVLIPIALVDILVTGAVKVLVK
jgi:NADH-quinone oxidoreductase subunit H